MRVAQTILRYILAGLVVVILGALSGWYFFLRAQTSTTTAIDTARGLGRESPTFTGNVGSTATNVVGEGYGSASSSANSSVPAQRLWEVDRAPTAGMAFAQHSGTSATSTHLYFAERASGYIFDADPRAGNVARLTNTLMPKTYEAIFAPEKYGVLLRSLDGSGAITTFAGTFASATPGAPQTLSGYYLAKNIRQVAVDQKSGALFYLTSDPASLGIIGTMLQWDGSKQKQVFSSPIASWRPSLINGQIILLESPADDTPGYAYTLKAGALMKLVGPVPGLDIAAHPSLNAFLFSSSSGGALALFAQVGKDAPVRLPLRTVAAKCVWLSDKSLTAYCAVPSGISSAHFMNDWYQGKVHAADVWWQVNATDGTAKILFSSQQALDVQRPTIDPSGNYIAFV